MRIFTLLLIITLAPLFSSAQIWIEDFDGSNTTNTPTWSYQSFCTDSDYLDIICDDAAGCTNEMSVDFTYNGSSGQYLGIRDADHNGCTANVVFGDSIIFSGIDISACAFPKIVYLCFTVAESRNMNGAFGNEWSTSGGIEDTWDGNSSVMISASIDGGTFSKVTAVEALAGSDSRPGIDVNCDGDAGDLGEPEITDIFTQYCFELPALGASLDLKIKLIGFNTQGEDVAIDDIAVYCETDETTLPAGATTLAACTPFVPNDPSCIWVEDFDGSNTTNPFVLPCTVTDTRDYLGIMCLAGTGCTTEMNADYTYGNTSGNFLGARDINGTPCGTENAVTATSTGINISTCVAPNTLYLCFDIAESDSQPREGVDTWDGQQSTTTNNSFLTFIANIDGITSNVLSFAAISNNNSGPAVDTNCDGTGEPLVAEVTSTFTTFCVELPSLGTSMNLSIRIGGLNTDGDDVAVDNISVKCTDNSANLPAGVTVSCAAVAPVNLSRFVGEIRNGTSILKWETSQELNNDYFEIEHSINARDFTTIGIQKGEGTSQILNSYDFTHRNVTSKDNYYRLKQVDFDGGYTYSKIVYLENENGQKESSIYPNPADQELTFEGEASELRIYDLSGAIVKYIIVSGDKTTVDISTLDAGFYMIEIIKSGKTKEFKKFVKR